MTSSLALGLSRRLGEEVRAALMLLTRIPVGSRPADSTGAAAFGLVGAGIGAIGSIPILVVGHAAPLAAAGLALALMAIVTGALHLDGLADTSDALVAPSPEAAERARIDPRIGPAGAAAVVLTLIVDAGLLSTLTVSVGPMIAAVACITAASAARTVAVAVGSLGPRGAGSGSGSWFVTHTAPASLVIAIGSSLLVGLLATIVAGVPGLLVGVAMGAIVALSIGLGLARGRGAVDGDVLGASIEVSFALVLLTTVLAT